MIRFNIDMLRMYPGATIHCNCRKSVLGQLGKWVLKSWGTHDAMVLHVPGIGTVVGNVAPLFARYVSIAEFEKILEEVDAEVRVLIPTGYRQEDGMKASLSWIRDVQGRMYDFMAYPRLFIKGITKNIFVEKFHWKWAEKPAGWTWAFWCTEGNAQAWNSKPLFHDIWKSKNPTPLTTEHREADGEFDDITAACVEEQ